MKISSTSLNVRTLVMSVFLGLIAISVTPACLASDHVVEKRSSVLPPNLGRPVDTTSCTNCHKRRDMTDVHQLKNIDISTH